MRLVKRILVSSVIAACSAGAPALATNLVQNGNFGTGTTADWTTFPSSGTYTFSSTGYNGVGTGRDGQTPYSGDSYLLFLGNFPDQGIAGVSQTLTDTAGATYDVSLVWSDTGTNDSANQLFSVLWNNTQIGSINGETGSVTWQPLSYTVTGTGSDTLTIEGYSSSTYNFVDNVSVSAVSSVPEPATYAMMMLGVCVAGGVALKRRSSFSVRTGYAT